MATALPYIVAGGGALLKGLFGWLGHKKEDEQQRKMYEEQRAAQERKYNAEKAYWGNMEGLRGSRYDLAQSILGRAGSRNMQMSPELLARLKTARPFPGSLPADPRVGDPGAGRGYDLLSGLFGGASNISLNALLARLQNQGGVTGGVPEGALTDLSQSMHGEEYCKSFPTAPGCR